MRTKKKWRRNLPAALPVGRSLEETHPHVADAWHPDNPYGPEQVTAGSQRVVKWQCHRGHEFCRKIGDMTSGRAGCPECRCHASDPANTLAARSPHLAVEWHPCLNGDLTPSDVSYISERRCYWQCQMGHEFGLTPKARQSKWWGVCPVCTGRGGGEDLFGGLEGAEEEALASRLAAPAPWLAERRKEPRRARAADVQWLVKEGDDER